MHVSLTIDQDWRNESADNNITILFSTISLDCYGTDHTTSKLCRIVRGTTNLTFAAFAARLSECVADTAIIALSFSQE